MNSFEKSYAFDECNENLPIVSVVIPIYNEEKYIERCLDSVFSQDFPKDKLEIILVDGGSNDKTLLIISNYIEKFNEKNSRKIRILNNPQKTVQFALNIGIKAATGYYIVRMDAHSEFASDYISKCVEYLETTSADNVGGTMVAHGSCGIQRVIASAYSSKFAFGGGDFHNSNYEGYADSVYLGAFRRNFLFKIGLYDENFPINEDDELNFRVIEQGGKIFVTPKIKSRYYPRNSYSELFKQYYKYGFWKVDVIKKHGKMTRMSHFVPFVFVIFLSIFPILIFIPTLKFFAFSLLIFYFLLDFIFSFFNEKKLAVLDKFRLMLVHFIMHVAYGTGFAVRLCQIFFRR